MEGFRILRSLRHLNLKPYFQGVSTWNVFVVATVYVENSGCFETFQRPSDSDSAQLKAFMHQTLVQCWSQIIANWSVNVNRRCQVKATSYYFSPPSIAKSSFWEGGFKESMELNPWEPLISYYLPLERSTRHSARDWHLFLWVIWTNTLLE